MHGTRTLRLTGRDNLATQIGLTQNDRVSRCAVCVSLLIDCVCRSPRAIGGSAIPVNLGLRPHGRYACAAETHDVVAHAPFLPKAIPVANSSGLSQKAREGRMPGVCPRSTRQPVRHSHEVRSRCD
jgi:hypothetical protein